MSPAATRSSRSPGITRRTTVLRMASPFTGGGGGRDVDGRAYRTLRVPAHGAAAADAPTARTQDRGGAASGWALCACTGSFDQAQAEGPAIGEDSGMTSRTATSVAQRTPQSPTALPGVQPLQGPEPTSEAMPATPEPGAAMAMGMTRIWKPASRARIVTRMAARRSRRLSTETTMSRARDARKASSGGRPCGEIGRFSRKACGGNARRTTIRGRSASARVSSGEAHHRDRRYWGQSGPRAGAPAPCRSASARLRSGRLPKRPIPRYVRPAAARLRARSGRRAARRCRTACATCGLRPAFRRP